MSEKTIHLPAHCWSLTADEQEVVKAWRRTREQGYGAMVASAQDRKLVMIKTEQQTRY
jgi:hypothetical protein